MSEIDSRKIRLIIHLRQAGITNTDVLSAIERTPRDLFVPHHFETHAYEDQAVPIGLGQTISQPYIVAMMTDVLEVEKSHSVLEIGTGSGYQAAVLSRLCRRVYTIERHRPLLELAEKRFNELKLRNITSLAADGMKGWPNVAGNENSFDRIIVTAAAGDEAPQALLDQMSIGGIMILPMGRDKASQFIYRITRTSEEAYETERLMPVRFVPLLPNVARDEPDPVVDDSAQDFLSGGFAFQPA